MAAIATMRNDTLVQVPSFTHAVSRSSELLSCAKTALKIAKAQHANEANYDGTIWWACQEPNLLSLCAWKDQSSQSLLDGLCEDGLALLRTMDVELKQLETLVRRRGHTNDPTEEIAASVRRLEGDAKELSSLVKTGLVFPRATAQYQRHSGYIASWLEAVATQQMAKLKEILKVRGNVLADQAQRRKMLHPQGPNNNISKNTNSQSQIHGTRTNGQASVIMTPVMLVEPKKVVPKAMDTPLFTMTPLQKPSNYTAAISTNGNYQNGGATSNNNNNNDVLHAATTPSYAQTAYGGAPSLTTSSGYGGYGSASSTGGYGTSGSYYGGGLANNAGGMRHRRGKQSATTGKYYQHNNNNTGDEQDDEANKVDSQIQQRKQQRQTQSRLEEAQQAEKTLAELGTMFSKMSTLISQQGEVLEKVEDDVEAGLVEVTAGQEEISILYSIKKGNRGLIIKVFGLLIFFIIFMRFYKR
jgi:hypothetical protein